MPRQNFLARPHPFIVVEMKPFLEANNVSALKPEVPQSLDALARGCAGAIISLAVTSSINLEKDEVIKQVWSKVSKLPLVFAGLLPFEKYQQTSERLAQQTGLAEEGSAVSAVTKAARRWARLMVGSMSVKTTWLIPCGANWPSACLTVICVERD